MTDPLDDPFGPAGDPWMAGRTALVTGGGQTGEEPGVGYAISRVFAAHGASVAVLDRDPAAADRTVAAITAAG
ncbi:NAD(P)-dependent oxidoreductase, partial [Modestobacter versicolor]